MSQAVPRQTQIHDDLRASELREWQLWSLTLGLLIVFGSGAVASFYLLLSTPLGDRATHQAALRLLGGLTVLIVLFCLHVLHVRMSVARVKRFLNEMNGMATGNLDVEECLAAIAKGMAHTHRASFSRILVLNQSYPALDVLSTHVSQPARPEPQDGRSYSLEDLPFLQRATETLQPAVLDRRGLRELPADSAERALVTGGLPGIDAAAVLPLATRRGTVGLLVLGVRLPRWRSALPRSFVSTAVALARHAGTVIEEATRREDALRDPLTELYNRRFFRERVHEEIERAFRDGHSLAILLCDLDRFKQINDTRGHQFGDEVLKAVARTIQDSTRGTDLHFRWGGDEIVVVLATSPGEGHLVAAERIRNGVRAYAKAAQLDLDVSIGIALCPQHGENEEELIRTADMAMYVAKKSSDRVHVGFLQYEVDEASVSFVYQPIRRVGSDEIHGHEVFVRDPGAALSPVELFAKYRGVGQLGRLKRLIFELQLKQAREAGVRRLFLNADLEFLQRVEPVPINPGEEVVIELSELDPNPRVADRLAAVRLWRGAGYRFAIDDFGAGYVSLPILVELQPEYVKVDRSSIVRALESAHYREFLRHLLRAAASIASGGLIAEGIETESELQLARDLEIRFAQGFLLGRPTEMTSSDARSEARVLTPQSG